ncbi:hypothetical protein [Kibdelosporangium phytohabitans]|uniref:hypothetical protein n=1 Tax=Kibdelosporangium phytohabitans TaxID=860235 RepID=UPI0012FA225F|nr:hypothetical protein [Kibdelosporangium phytohabitans]
MARKLATLPSRCLLLREATATGAPRRLPDGLGAALADLAEHGEPHTAPAFGHESPAGTASAQVEDAVHHHAALTAALASPRALIGRRRPGRELGRAARRCVTAVEHQRVVHRRLAGHIDDRLVRGVPCDDEISAQCGLEPGPVPTFEIVTAVREMIEPHAEASDPVVRALRGAAASVWSDGCGRVLDALAAFTPTAVTLPVFRRGPLLGTMLPGAFLACAAAAYATPGLLTGWATYAVAGAVVFLWFMLTWLLLARHPVGDSEASWRGGFAGATTAMFAGLAGGAAGYVVTRLVAPAPLVPSEVLLCLAVVVAVPLALASWRAATKELRSAPGLAALHHQSHDLTTATLWAVARWRTARRRDLVAATVFEAAACLNELAGCPPEVVRLVLRGAWTAAASGDPMPPGGYGRRAEDLVACGRLFAPLTVTEVLI